MSVGSKTAIAGVGRPAADALGAHAATQSGVLDRDYLRRFTLGSATLEHEVLRLFAGEMPRYVDQLRSAESPKAWADAAHTIKGSAQAVGALRVAIVAEMAERLDFHGTDRVVAIEAIASAVEEVRRVIEQTMSQA
jgi:HPt (histidine-containing phosphotransfer) domain-containing protein